MHTTRIVARQIKKIKWQRPLSCSAGLNNEFEIKSTLKDIVMPKTTFLNRLWRDLPKFKNRVALECAETKKSYTYEQLRLSTANFATSLHKKLGLKAGDVVAAMLPNSPEFPVVAFGTLQAGCILTTLNPIYKEQEIRHQSTIAQPKVFITRPDHYDTVIKGLKSANIEAKIVIIDNPDTPIPDGAIRYTEIAEKGEPDYTLLDKIERKDDDVAFIPFSSGTTGLPKGVEITFGNLKASIEVMSNDANCYCKEANENFQDIVPCIMPFFHIYGSVVTMIGHLAKGCKLVTMSSFSSSLYFNLLKSQKASLLYLVPPIAILLGKHPDVTHEHFSNVRHIVCGAAPLAASDVDAILQKTKNDLEFNQGYGATETTSLATATFIGNKIHDYNSCGDIMASIKLKYVDSMTGKPVAPGEVGEMYVKGPIVMKGYHKDEKSTKECLTDDGYFRTGDLGYYKAGVGAFITDRIKELIKVKGLQVAPAELESILRSHPAVQEAGVIGVAHNYYGEVPKAFVILKKDKKSSPQELQDFVASKVAPFKKIEEVVLVDNIPKNSTGKILRRELKKMYA